MNKRQIKKLFAFYPGCIIQEHMAKDRGRVPYSSLEEMRRALRILGVVKPLVRLTALHVKNQKLYQRKHYIIWQFVNTYMNIIKRRGENGHS